MKKPLSILVFSFVIAAAPALAMTGESEAPTEVAAATEAVAEEAATEETDPMQRIRCRNQRVTGSNARRIRVCLTIAEWRQLSSEGNRDARRVMDAVNAGSDQQN